MKRITSLHPRSSLGLNMPKCDNIGTIHVPVICSETAQGYKVYCRRCDTYWCMKKDGRGVADNRAWGEAFFEDVVQPPHPLFFKLHPERMSVV